MITSLWQEAEDGTFTLAMLACHDHQIMEGNFLPSPFPHPIFIPPLMCICSYPCFQDRIIICSIRLWQKQGTSAARMKGKNGDREGGKKKLTFLAIFKYLFVLFLRDSQAPVFLDMFLAKCFKHVPFAKVCLHLRLFPPFLPSFLYFPLSLFQSTLLNLSQMPDVHKDLLHYMRTEEMSLQLLVLLPTSL